MSPPGGSPAGRKLLHPQQKSRINADKAANIFIYSSFLRNRRCSGGSGIKSPAFPE
jgi:hypothetical protein